MNGSIVRRLMLKDLYLMRWTIVPCLVAGGGRGRPDAAQHRVSPTSAACRSSASS